MKRSFIALAASVAGVGIFSTMSWAAVALEYSTGFESPTFSATPGTTNNGQPRNASINAQDGWFVYQPAGAKMDEEISTAIAKTGSQAWHVSNWYSEGFIKHEASPAIQAAGPSAA